MNLVQFSFGRGGSVNGGGQLIRESRVIKRNMERKEVPQIINVNR